MKNVVVIDFNNLSARQFFGPNIDANSEYPNYNLWKFNIFNEIFTHTNTFNADEVILACDTSESWRMLHWKRYKESRKEKKQNDDINWDKYHIQFTNYTRDLKKHTPFKTFKIKRCEGDDIVAVLSKKLSNENGSVNIISTDEDFVQCINENVRLYNPIKKEFRKADENFVIKKSLMGQKKDFILNVKTPLDHPKDVRKPGLGEKTVEKILQEGYMTWLIKNNLLERFKFNQILIDFEKIPPTIQKRIIDEYNQYKLPEQKELLTFLEKYKFKYFIEEYHKHEKIFNRIFQTNLFDNI